VETDYKTSISVLPSQDYQRVWAAWLLRQTPVNQATIGAFAELILNTDQRLYVRMSFGACFLYRYKPFAYFIVDKTGVYIGFYHGKDILKRLNSPLFEVDERKLVKVVRLSASRLEEEEFIGLFLQMVDSAIEIDSEKGQKRDS